MKTSRQKQEVVLAQKIAEVDAQTVEAQAEYDALAKQIEEKKAFLESNFKNDDGVPKGEFLKIKDVFEANTKKLVEQFGIADQVHGMSLKSILEDLKGRAKVLPKDKSEKMIGYLQDLIDKAEKYRLNDIYLS